MQETYYRYRRELPTPPHLRDSRFESRRRGLLAGVRMGQFSASFSAQILAEFSEDKPN